MSTDFVRPPYRLAQAAERLNITPHQAKGAFLRGELDGFRLGRTILIRPECVDRLRFGEAELAVGAGTDASQSPGPREESVAHVRHGDTTGDLSSGDRSPPVEAGAEQRDVPL